jgi:hypothetical protein
MSSRATRGLPDIVVARAGAQENLTRLQSLQSGRDFLGAKKRFCREIS